jgi:hypothetical protein
MFSEWLKNNSAPDAVFAGNERLIDGVKRIIWKEYPDTEIQFMSVSNSISQKESPWTIFIPPEKVAAVASDIMSRRLLNRDYKASYKEIIETEPGK